MDKVKVFFYGTLKRGGLYNGLYIHNNEGYIGEDSIDGQMFIDSDENTRLGYPIVLRGKGTVNGEVWNIKRRIFLDIARIEEGAGYCRATATTRKGETVQVFLINMDEANNASWYKNFTKQIETF